MSPEKSRIELKTKLHKRQKPVSTEKEQSGKIGLIKDTKYYPKSYRWRASDIEMIQQLVDKVNQASNRKIDATKILRGALVLASKATAERLLNAIVQAERDSIL